MTDIPEMRKRIYNEAASAVEDWFPRQLWEPHEPMYLYYRRMSLVVRPTAKRRLKPVFYIGPDAPSEEWTLGWNERISPTLTKARATEKVVDIAQRLPIIAPD